MPRRRSNLGRRTRGAEAVRRVIANQTEEERASANERNRQRMAQIRAEEAAEQRAARLEGARLRARRSRSAASYLLRCQQNERDRLRVAERRQRETADQRQTRLRAQQSRDYNRLSFRYNPADDYSLSRHVLIGTMTEVCPCCKALKFNGKTKGIVAPPEKLNCLNLENRQSH